MSVRNFYTIRKSKMPNLMSSTLKFKVSIWKRDTGQSKQN